MPGAVTPVSPNPAAAHVANRTDVSASSAALPPAELAPQPGSAPDGAPAAAARAVPSEVAPRQGGRSLGTVIGDGLSNSAPVHALAEGVRAAASLVPHEQIAHLATHALPDQRQGAADIRANVQRLQGALAQAEPAQRPALQVELNEALIAHGQQRGSIGDRLIPTLGEATQSAVYILSAFGLGRSTGLAAVDATVKRLTGQHADLGWFAQPPAPGTPPLSGELQLATFAAQLAAGSIGVGIGDVLATHLLLPAFGAMSRQQEPTHREGVVTDEHRDLMNQFRRGAGDDLRAQVPVLQHELGVVGSETNINIGQRAFAAGAVLQTALSGTQAFGFGGIVGGIAAAATVPAFVQAAAIAINKQLGTMDVPHLDALRSAVASGLPETQHERDALLASLPRDKVPLFTTQHKDDAPNVLEAVVDSLRHDPLRDPVPDRSEVAAAQRAAQVIAGTAANVATAIGQRVVQTAQALAPATAIFAATGPLAASVSNEHLQAAIKALGTGVAIYSLVREFNGLLEHRSGPSDAALGAHRQAAVDRAHPPAAPVHIAPGPHDTHVATPGTDGITEIDATVARSGSSASEQSFHTAKTHEP